MKINTIICIICSVGIIVISIPLILEKVKPNGLYGFRTYKTLSDETIWYKANKFLGCSLVFAGLISILLMLLKEYYPQLIPFPGYHYFGIVVFIVPIFIAAISSCIYLSKL